MRDDHKSLRCATGFVAIAALAVLAVSRPVCAQIPPEMGKVLQATQQVAPESGAGSFAFARGADNRIYILNRRDNCIWILEREGQPLEKIAAQGTNLAEARDIAILPSGELVLAFQRKIRILGHDGTFVREFGMDGLMDSSIPQKDSAGDKAPKGNVNSVAVLHDGRILANGSPSEGVITVFDSTGKKLYSLGRKIRVPDNPKVEGLFSSGTIVVDPEDNLFVLFNFAVPPTIRKYNLYDKQLAEWHPDTPIVRHMALVAETALKNPVGENRFTVPMLLGSGTFDEETKTLWVLAGSQLLQMDPEGAIVGQYVLMGPGGIPLPAMRILLRGNSLLVLSPSSGVYEFPLPK